MVDETEVEEMGIQNEATGNKGIKKAIKFSSHMLQKHVSQLNRKILHTPRCLYESAREESVGLRKKMQVQTLSSDRGFKEGE
ncbi:MAG: hypothetical protein MPK62_11420 [Alphaproteobacteria bacterium]|nr:hypothetical protein [Alphaproteobacteria bacterium]